MPIDIQLTEEQEAILRVIARRQSSGADHVHEGVVALELGMDVARVHAVLVELMKLGLVGGREPVFEN